MTESQKLLREYADKESEAAFRELVARYIDLVYSTALRRVGGDTHQAEDIVQSVFADLAQQARRLPEGVMLGGWLHRKCCFATMNLHRAEARRKEREQESVAMQMNDSSDQIWKELEPVLDGAIQELGEADRDAVTLRFFERKNFHEIAEATGVSENAAQKRVARAIERLRNLIEKQGVALSAVALAALMERAASAAPPHCLGKVTAGVLAGAGTGSVWSFWKIAAAFVAAGLLTVGILSGRQNIVTTPGNAAPAPAIRVPDLAVKVEPTKLAPSADVIVTSVTTEPSSLVTNNVIELLIVTDDTGEPIPNVPLEYRTWGGSSELVSKKLATARNGVCKVQYPSDVDELILTTRIDDFADTRLDWNRNHGEVVPEKFRLRVARGVALGGKATDARGEPVEGARIGVSTLSEDPTDPETPILSVQTQLRQWETKTDADGNWAIRRIPSRALANISAYARHEHYLDSPSVALPEDSEAMKQARAGKFVFHLEDGGVVSGVIIQESGEPIAGAKVLVSRHSFSESRAAVADAGGKFTVKGCKVGKTKITASVSGYAARTMDFELTEPTPPQKIVLKPGRVMRMRLVDHEGKGIARAHLYYKTFINKLDQDASVEGLPQTEYEPRTDADGNLVWNDSPTEVALFEIDAKGFRRLSDVPIRADGLEHVIEMARCFSIQGEVHDSETGKPLSEFHVITGFAMESFPNVAPQINWSPFARDTVRFAGGKFFETFEMPIVIGAKNLKYIFRFEAEGYEPFITGLIAEAKGPIQFDVSLHRLSDTKLSSREP